MFTVRSHGFPKIFQYGAAHTPNKQPRTDLLKVGGVTNALSILFTVYGLDTTTTQSWSVNQSLSCLLQSAVIRHTLFIRWPEENCHSAILFVFHGRKLVMTV